MSLALHEQRVPLLLVVENQLPTGMPTDSLEVVVARCFVEPCILEGGQVDDVNPLRVVGTIVKLLPIPFQVGQTVLVAIEGQASGSLGPRTDERHKARLR